MSDLLACRRGTVITIEGCEGIPGTLTVDGFEGRAAIIVAPAVTQKVNVQFQTSLKEAVYAYVFGDQMGSISLSGVAFASRCDDDSNGVKELFEYYDDYRASVRKEVVTVTIADKAFSGFLTSMNVRPQDPEHMISAFNLEINVLPEKKNGGGS
jgi:hypothetical protein